MLSRWRENTSTTIRWSRRNGFHEDEVESGGSLCEIKVTSWKFIKKSNQSRWGIIWKINLDLCRNTIRSSDIKYCLINENHTEIIFVLYVKMYFWLTVTRYVIDSIVSGSLRMSIMQRAFKRGYNDVYYSFRSDVLYRLLPVVHEITRWFSKSQVSQGWTYWITQGFTHRVYANLVLVALSRHPRLPGSTASTVTILQTLPNGFII